MYKRQTINNLEDSKMTEEEAKLQDELASFRQKFIDAMDDDVNTDVYKRQSFIYERVK